MDSRKLVRRAEDYAIRRGVAINFEAPLGRGQDGTVWTTGQGLTAVKVVERESNYYRERDCYILFQQESLSNIIVSDETIGKTWEFSIPELIDYDDELWVLELGIVQPPYILDFGKCYLNAPPTYPEETVREAEEHSRELFEDRWPIVAKLLQKLEAYQVYYIDANPKNIQFE